MVIKHINKFKHNLNRVQTHLTLFAFIICIDKVTEMEEVDYDFNLLFFLTVRNKPVIVIF